jgi:hypothetical protein
MNARGLAALLALGAVACPAGEQSPPPPDLGAARHAACVALAEVWCSSAAVCRSTFFQSDYGSEAICVERRALLCDKTLFGAGSSLTPARVRSCAAASDLSALDLDARCEAFLRIEATRQQPPACLALGTLAQEARCVIDAQCALGSCSPTELPCGRCRPLLSKGQRCFDDAECERGKICAASGCTEPLALGGKCGPTAPCHADLDCRAGVCARRSAAGEACDPTAPNPCALWPKQLGCSPVRKVCEPLVLQASGQRCGELEDGSVAWCEHGSFCVSSEVRHEGVCVHVLEDRSICILSAGVPPSTKQYTQGGPCRPPATCFENRCQIIEASACSAGPPP